MIRLTYRLRKKCRSKHTCLLWIVKSVADALYLDLRLEQESFINSKRAYHWVIAIGQNVKQSWIVGCNENKLSFRKYQEPYVLDNEKVER